MNNIKVSSKATWDPGAVKAPPVKGTATAKLRVFIAGPPALTVKNSPVARIKPSVATFNPGAVKAVPVCAKTAKSKATTARAKATATAKPRSYVTSARAKARAMLAPAPGTVAGKAHDHKTAVSRATHVPPALPAGTRNYVITKRVTAHAVQVRPAGAHDRKAAFSRATFGSFNGGRQPHFGWR